MKNYKIYQNEIICSFYLILAIQNLASISRNELNTLNSLTYKRYFFSGSGTDCS